MSKAEEAVANLRVARDSTFLALADAGFVTMTQSTKSSEDRKARQLQAIKDIASQSKDQRLAFLKSAGIIDSNGKLRKPYTDSNSSK